MSCAQCRFFPDDAGPATPLLAPTIPHTGAKLSTVLRDGGMAVASTQGILRVEVPSGDRHRFVELVRGNLGSRELDTCRALELPDPERPLQPADLARVRSLGQLTARYDADWLVEMMREQRFTTAFQPIVAADRQDRPFAYECLLRGRDAEGTLVRPNAIFDTARDADMLFAVDREARIKAIREASHHALATKIFVNFNPTSIYDPDYCLRTTHDAAREVNVRHEDIVIEVVESDQVQDPDHLVDIIRAYREMGYGIALDDFGAGFASVNLLNRLEPDFVKFDMEMIRDVHRVTSKGVVLRRLLGLARELGITSICEGVETADEARWLAEHGADHLQEFAFGRPELEPTAPRVPQEV